MNRKRPAWVKPFARYDFDFVNNRYWSCYAGLTNSPIGLYSVSCDRSNASGILYYPDSTGRMVSAIQYGARINDLGLWVEGRNTNYLLYSRDLSNAAWGKTNTTAARNQVGLTTSANTASLVTATANDGTILQEVSFTETSVIGSAYIKRGTGTGTISFTQNGTDWEDITSQINNTSWTRLSFDAETLSTAYFGFKLGTSGDTIIVDCTQLENVVGGSVYPSTPINTTTAAATRLTELPTVNTTGPNYNNGKLIIDNIAYDHIAGFYVEFSGNWQKDNSCSILGGGNNAKMQLYIQSGDDPKMTLKNDANSAVTANSPTYGFGNVNKAAGMINGLGTRLCLNGGDIATSTDKTAFGGTETHNGLGNRGAGDRALNGTIRRLAFWVDRDLRDGELIEMTR